jgi:hypothetical protein
LRLRRKFQDLNIIKSDNGFPYAWRAGRVEQLIRNILERKAQEQLTVGSVMLINPTWLLDRDLATEIRDAGPDFIICHDLVDPAIPQVNKIIQDSGIPHLFIGNANQYRLDFWAMVCDLNFQAYTNSDLQLRPGARKFMCLNRKPHAHRRILVQHLEPVRELGHLVSGADLSLTDANTGNYDVPNDVYTLGDIATWQDSYLNIVTETTFNNTDFFISEKTWKPILGLRPFFVYGQPKLREYLRQQGFDTFEDIIDYTDCNTEQDYAELAVRTINTIIVNRSPHFQQRLINNQQRFRTYVYEQWDRLFKLNLADYV